MIKSISCRSAVFAFILLACLNTPRLAAQSPNTCFQLFFPIVAAETGDTVCIPLLVRDFQQILTMQLGVTWDASALRLVEIDRSNTDLPPSSPNHIGFNTLYANELRFVWETEDLLSGSGTSLPDSAELFRLCFRVISSTPGIIPLHIGNTNPFFVYEVIQYTGISLPLAQQIGGIAVGGVLQGALVAAATCSAATLCSQPTGSASVTVSGGQLPYTYQWSGPNGFSASTPALSQLFPGDYRVTVTDVLGNSVVAEIRVATSENTLIADAQSSNALCGQANGCVSLQVTGGQTPYTFSWSAGGSTTSQNCSLPPGQHSATVTDAQGCSLVSTVTVGDQEDINFNLSTNFIECDETGSISIEINKDIPFQYQWSSGDTTQNVSGLSANWYAVTITAPGGCSTIGYTSLFNITEFNWGLSALAECGTTSLHTGDLRLYFNPTGTLTFPVAIRWSDGSIHHIQEKPTGVVLDSLIGTPEGFYHITVTDATGCSTSIENHVDCSTMPALPDSLPAFYVKDENGSLDSCTGVYARYFNQIGQVSFSLDWFGAEIKELRQFNLPGLGQNNFSFGPEGSSLGVQWQSASPVSLPEESLLFEVCFEPIDGEAQVPNLIRFGDSPVDVQLLDGQQNALAFIGQEGYVLFDTVTPLQPGICQFGVIPPDCRADGNSQVVLEQCNPGLHLDALVSSVDGEEFLGETGSLLTLPAGKFIVYAFQESSDYHRFFVQIPDADDADHCVWPGDADNNNATNHYDLLYIGLAYGAQGETRANASQEWTGQDAPDWLQATVERQVNFKNIDGNGDGVINTADTMSISQNWSRVINPSQDDPFAMPNSGGTVQAIIQLDADTLEVGQPVLLPLILGSAAMPMDNVYGLAFSIVYDPNIMQENVRLIPGDSWLGDAGSYLFMQRNFPEQGHLDIAITRTDGVPVSGWGVIGDLLIIIEDNIFEPPLTPETIKTPLYITGLCSINANETTKWTNGAPLELVIQRENSASQEAYSPDQAVLLYPNPAAALVHISSKTGTVKQVEISDLSGRVFTSLASDKNDLDVSVAQLPVGAYLVRVLTAEGLVMRKLSVLR